MKQTIIIVIIGQKHYRHYLVVKTWKRGVL